MSGFKKFLEIRKAYKKILPHWEAQYLATGDMRQDPYFMDWEMTPIERNVWSDIRFFGLPFYPQVPVLNYFIDFACPMMKIGIECDGKAWHDHDLDKARDARLAAAGWMIFRIGGHECNRTIDPWGDVEEVSGEEVEKYFMTTSEGIVSAIKRRYFDDSQDDRYSEFVTSTLFEHQSTKETFPKKRKITESKPVLVGDVLNDYLAKIIHRMERVA